MIRRPPRSTQSRSSAASDVYKRQTLSFFSNGFYGDPFYGGLSAGLCLFWYGPFDDGPGRRSGRLGFERLGLFFGYRGWGRYSVILRDFHFATRYRRCFHASVVVNGDLAYRQRGPFHVGELDDRGLSGIVA